MKENRIVGAGFNPALFGFLLCCKIAIPVGVSAQAAKPGRQADWDKTIELAKKEGEVVVSLTTSNGKALGQVSRRVDVDTKWLREFGVLPAKDYLTLEQYYKRQNQSEEKINRLREPAAALARELLG